MKRIHRLQLLTKQSIYTCLWNRLLGGSAQSIFDRSPRGPRFLSKNSWQRAFTCSFPTPSLIIDLGTLLVPSADHPNDRARGERIGVSGHCGADWYYKNGRLGRTDQTVGWSEWLISSATRQSATQSWWRRQTARSGYFCVAHTS